VYPLVSLDVTGRIAFQNKEFRIDEIPDFTGLTVEGNYRRDRSVFYNGLNWGGVPGGDQENNVFPGREPIALSREYTWRYVYNTRDSSGGGLGYADQDPGILISIGRWGDIGRDDLGGAFNSDEDGLPNRPVEGLRGYRIPIAKLHQVTGITVAASSALGVVYFDDPRLIDDGSFASEIEIAPEIRDWRDSAEWVNRLKDTAVTISYDNGFSRTLSLIELYHQWETYFYNGNRMSGATGGGVNNLIGVEFWAGRTYNSATNAQGISTGTSNIVHSRARSAVDVFVPDVRNGRTWSWWAAQAEPKIRIWYRGVSADIDVPVYNRISRIEWELVNGGIELNGYSVVDGRPDGLWNFQQQIKVKPTFPSPSTRYGASCMEERMAAAIPVGLMTTKPSRIRRRW